MKRFVIITVNDFYYVLLSVIIIEICAFAEHDFEDILAFEKKCVAKEKLKFSVFLNMKHFDLLNFQTSFMNKITDLELCLQRVYANFKFAVLTVISGLWQNIFKLEIRNINFH